MNTSGEEDMLRLLAAAKAAVRAACRVTATVQSSSLSHIAKSDSSPVTVADFAAQAIVTIVLRHQLALPLDSPFLMMGEEDEATFRGAGPEVMARVAQLVEVTIPKAAFLASAEVATDSSAQATWSVEDVAAAISMGGYAGYEAGSSSFWVLDPVDGTKGFLRRGQYAVGLAYVIRGTVSLAVIGCPNLPFPALIDGHVPGSKPAPGSVAIQFASQNVQSSPSSHADAVALRLLQLRKHGLVFPYVCSGCTTLNESYPSVCQFDECGTPNQTYVLANSALEAELQAGRQRAPADGVGFCAATVGSLCSAVAGAGAFQEALEPTAEVAAAPMRLCVSSSPPTAPNFIIAQSFEITESDAAACAHLRKSLCISSSPLLLDSMVKYCLVARGEAAVYFRLLGGTYCECIWDHAPGFLLVAEAGGKCSDVRGSALDFRHGQRLIKNVGIVASNGVAHADILATLAQTLPGASSP